jgi:hypothetical protein
MIVVLMHMAGMTGMILWWPTVALQLNKNIEIDMLTREARASQERLHSNLDIFTITCPWIHSLHIIDKK